MSQFRSDQFNLQPVDYSPLFRGMEQAGAGIGSAIQGYRRGKEEDRISTELSKAYEGSFKDGYFDPQMFTRKTSSIKGLPEESLMRTMNAGTQYNFSKSQQEQLKAQSEREQKEAERLAKEEAAKDLAIQFRRGEVPAANDIMSLDPAVWRRGRQMAESSRREESKEAERQRMEAMKTRSEILENEAQARSADALATQRAQPEAPDTGSPAPAWAEEAMKNNPELYWDGKKLTQLRSDNNWLNQLNGGNDVLRLNDLLNSKSDSDGWRFRDLLPW